MRIGWIEVLKKAYGATAYTSTAQSFLCGRHDLEVINVGLDPFKKILYPKILFRLWGLKGEKEIWIRNFDSVLTMPYDGTKGKNVALIFHIDSSYQPAPLKPFFILLEKVFYRHLKRADAIVTISRYWQDHFLARGYPKVHLIYNGFDLGQFQFKEQEILDFKERFRLEGKPIVYLGNCQRIKGVVEAYEELKEQDLHLVTSGRKEVDLPIMNLNLGYRDYLLLLKASSAVITLSKFKEGWNRTAHEAMLCKTPVIGSGLGGMRELLEGGGQIVCEDFRDLRQKTEYALDHPQLGERGHGFAKQFTMEKFRDEWIRLIESLNQDE